MEKNLSIAQTTAIIVFSPFLAGTAYLLTWPKNQTVNKRRLIMGTKGRKNTKKPKQQKGKKQEEEKKK